MKLLLLYNKVWEEGRMPMSWKEVIIVPVGKPGKDASKPENFRPPHICKLMEWMVNERLMYCLGKKEAGWQHTKVGSGKKRTLRTQCCLEDEKRKAWVF